MKKVLATLSAIAIALVVTVTSSPAGAGNTTRYSDNTPFWGADQVYSDVVNGSATDCTGGFTLFDGSGAGHNFSLLANHCSSNSNIYWYAQGTGAYIGYTEADNASLDTQVIHQYSATNSWGYIYTDPNTPYRKVYSWETTNQDVIGNIACIDGAVSREQCLRINQTGQNWAGSSVAVTARCPNGRHCTLEGDSGAPVYAICHTTACEGDVEAMGIFVGSISHTVNGVFSYEDEVWIPIRYIMSWIHSFNSHMNVRCLLCTAP